MDCPSDSRCNDCTLRAGRLCLAVPRPPGAELLRTGDKVAVCRAYQGPQGELTALESKPVSSLRVRVG